ncbi:hypothetical protein TREMEDRAFT_59846 [Tremella mesenterica DSM 1558]|uniref:uncharacterized protein n=1 Tax=Tremella mesenterica (strain ATCC 24925 / CBS 8224 / DSM 1558 / NBRC 9311 / NRRL Y-6157 / RJB 2259-6 / UBC 559-6) TaxID=578456 RepID=UPI0003F4A213|nr:uncharacterized protein TREMEDRAFT_59846 [Tremella mesenterica DSM 1558]EIW73673.1 hypothetical protein TREMEDRAFT_59846 [Tremella mesenterica DSM 1558]
MAATPLAGFPYSGSFSIQLAGSLNPLKRSREEDELVSLRYPFKPSSIQPKTQGNLEYTPQGRRGVLRPRNAPQQVFDVREEENKARECVLIYDPATNGFTLHALPTTLHMTLNRSPSTNSLQLALPPVRRPSDASTSSSTSVPLAQGWPANRGERNSNSSQEKYEVSSMVGPDTPALPAAKRPRVSEPAPTPTRPKTGGKTIKLAQLLEPPKPEPKPKAKAKPKAEPKPRTKKPSAAVPKKPPTPIKVKSVEVIEDSDEEFEEVGADDGDDEFARLVEQSLAQGADEEDEEEESSEEEEEDDGLGGARLVIRHADYNHGRSEWI